MIPPPKFAHDYGSFWNSVLPMADALVRSINLNYERFAPELKDAFKSNPHRRGLVNETAFMLAKERWAGASSDEGTLKETAYAAAVRNLAAIDAKADVSPLTDLEWRESVVLGARLIDFCNLWPGEKVTFSPAVQGCGFVDSLSADLCIGAALMEVKAGDRSFRSTDLRQVLTYAAFLNLRDPGRVTSSCLVNPRRGIFYAAENDDLCRAAGGVSASYAFAQIAAFASGEFNSI